MAIQKLDNIAEGGDKNLTGFDKNQGFIQAEKPARQWFNFLFNSITKKVNEVITALESLVISTDGIADGAVTVAKLAADFKITGDKIEKNADLDTPKLSTTYALTTLDAPNINLAADGSLKRSTYAFGTAATKNVGLVNTDLVERGADGFPKQNNALGVDQTWQDLKASRVVDTVYTNSTGRPIVVSVSVKTTNATIASLSILGYVNNIQIDEARTYSAAANYAVSAVIIVPAGATYKFEVTSTASTSVTIWQELR